jgi:hypothetical protein
MAKYVLKENKILREYESTKDIAKIFRDIVKEKYGLTSRDVSITARSYSSVDISIKSTNALQYKTELEQIAKTKEKIDYDKYSGEILSGGNTFVFVNIDWNFTKELYKIIEKEILKKASKEFLDPTNFDVSNTLTIFDDIIIMKVNARGTFDGYSVVDFKTGKTFSGFPKKNINEIFQGVLNAILENKKSEQILKKYFK